MTRPSASAVVARDASTSSHSRRPPQSTRSRLLAAAALTTLCLVPPRVAAHSFPYVPTQILMPAACVDFATCHGRSTAYIFTQTDNGGVEFLALNFTEDV